MSHDNNDHLEKYLTRKEMLCQVNEDNHQGAGNAIVKRSQTAIERRTMLVGLLMLGKML